MKNLGETPADQVEPCGFRRREQITDSIGGIHDGTDVIQGLIGNLIFLQNRTKKCIARVCGSDGSWDVKRDAFQFFCRTGFDE